MRKLACLLLFFLLTYSISAQECPSLVPDTMTLPGDHKLFSGESLETVLKNRSTIKIFHSSEGRLFLKFIITENFYFNQVSTLEIQSGTKSYYVKKAKQYKVDKTHGMYVTEIYSNYLSTLKEHGITAIDFGGAVTEFTRQDAGAVKLIAQCIYKSHAEKNAK